MTALETLATLGFTEQLVGGNLTAFRRVEGTREILITNTDGERAITDDDAAFLIGTYDVASGEEITLDQFDIDELAARAASAIAGNLPQPEPQTITVVMIERSSPFPPCNPRPLIYTLDVIDPEDEDDIIGHLARMRYEEIVGDDPDATTGAYDTLVGIRDGIELQFAFAGDVSTIIDWRN